MTDQKPQDESPALDYRLCRFEGTRLAFRGPVPDMGQPFVAVLGGCETFGKYIADPFPALLEGWMDLPVMNLGIHQAGLSLFAEEGWLLDKASQADVTVLQVLGAQNMSNRLYSVHSRRNDRFLAVSPALRDMYPDVDFSGINFTGHLLETLAHRSRASFDVLVQELKWAWIQRMRRILQTIDSPVLLLWISDRAPDETGPLMGHSEPLFVDRAMLDALSDVSAGLVEIVGNTTPSLEGKVFDQHEVQAAQVLPGPADHSRIAEALAPEIMRIRDDPSAMSRARATG